MDTEGRIRKLEETQVAQTEAMRFKAEQDVRDDAFIERLRVEAATDRMAIRTEADRRYADHEDRLRTLEKVAWTTLGMTSATFLSVIIPSLLKAFH